MDFNRQLCTKQWIGFCLLVCLGCGTPHNSPTTATQSDKASGVAETSNQPSSESQKPVVVTDTSNGSPTTTVNPPKASTPIVDQVPTTPIEPPAAKPTAEQLARWKYVSFDPLQLLAYRENDKTGFVSFIAATNDGQQYVLGGTRLTLWNIDGDQPVHEFIEAKTEKDERLLSFAVSPVGDWCVAGDASGLLRKFDIKGRQEMASKPTDSYAVTSIAISPDGKEIATIAFVSEVTIWNAETLEKKNQFKVDAREVKHLQYVSAQGLIAAGETMSTWDTSSGNKIKTYPSEKYQTAVALSPNDKELVFGADDFLQRWNLTDDQASGEYRGVPARHSAIRFTSDGLLVAVATGDAIQILDAATGQRLQVIDASGSTISDVSWIPQKHLLLVGTDTGRTRIWGRPDEGQAFGLSPLHSPSVNENTNPNDPASVAENLAAIDLRLLPKLPDAKQQSDQFYSVHYSAPVAVEELRAFYRYILVERGWSESSDQATEYTIPFRKNGYTLNISPYGEKPTETVVSISSLGNYDLRQTPKLEEFLKETVYEGDTSIIYKVKASLLQIETDLLEKLHRAGWTAVVRLNRSQSEEPDRRDFEFVKNGTVLRVTVQRDKDDATLFVISYGQSLSLHALPVPADVGLMEWDDYLEAQMVANTSLSLQEATAFYEDAMQKQGWIPRQQGRQIDKDVVYLPYYWGQRDVTIALAPIAEGMVRIQAGKYSESSWQQPDEQVADAETDESSAEAGIEAADLPILHAIGAPTYEAERGGNISFELEKISLIELSKEYSEAMKTLGWKVKAFGDPLEDSVGLHFEKGSKIVYYQSGIDPRGIGSVSFSGNGLLWTKTIASNQLISYVAWLRNNKFPATLKRLGDYQTEMEKLLGDR